MVRIIEATVPHSLWDEWYDIIVVSPGLTEQQRAAAVRALLDERYGTDDGPHQAPAVG